MGRPELVVEVTATSASIDLHAKKHAYQRHGISEYLVWLTTERTVQWFHLRDEAFTLIEPEGDSLHSRIFPGLALRVAALLEHDAPRLVAGLSPAAGVCTFWTVHYGFNSVALYEWFANKGMVFFAGYSRLA